MRVAILETVKTQAGFEQEFDRLIFKELRLQGYEPVLYLPEHSSLPVDFGVPVEYLAGGEIVDYEGAGKLKKMWLSLQREQRRIKWFNAAYVKAVRGEVDAILLTTATYRYLRSLHKSKLKDSPVPVIFIFLGVNPQERPKYLAQAKPCEAYPNVKLKITTLRNDFQTTKLTKLELINPPVLVPPGIKVQKQLRYREPIKIGFFGHYRKGEKDIEGIINAFLAAGLGSKAQLVVQAAPTTEEDKTDLDRIMGQHAGDARVSFIQGKLLGKQWYDALQAVDVLFLPYSNPRYLYNWSAVYFNAIGLYKPVLTTKMLNPEVLAAYKIGREVDLGNLQAFTKQLQEFLTGYETALPGYQKELERVNAAFSTEQFLKNVLK